MEVHVVVPEGIDDPARPSGGNAYDRRVCDGLAALGWSVALHPVSGAEALGQVLDALPDGALVLLDGLISSTAPEVLVPQANRLRLVSLVHMPLGCATEHDVLTAVSSVITTSRWSRQALLEQYGLAEERVHVAAPGVDAAAVSAGTPDGGALLCVGAVIPGKGHDVLIDALAELAGSWRCVCVGSLERDPGFVEQLRRRLHDLGLEDRVQFLGPLSGDDLARRYREADVLVLASRGETYGMVVTEALSAGLPVIASDVGGVPEALGYDLRGARPGLLVPPGDPVALGDALRTWLGDADLRRHLRATARGRRVVLARWSTTSSAVAGVLAEAAR